VAANVAMALISSRTRLTVHPRVVRTPKRWDGIQTRREIWRETSSHSDARAFVRFFWCKRKLADSRIFPTFAFCCETARPGEYIVESPGTEHEGHFGLAVGRIIRIPPAPNRRFADLVTQRLLKGTVREYFFPRPIRKRN